MTLLEKMKSPFRLGNFFRVFFVYIGKENRLKRGYLQPRTLQFANMYRQT